MACWSASFANGFGSSGCWIAGCGGVGGGVSMSVWVCACGLIAGDCSGSIV